MNAAAMAEGRRRAQECRQRDAIRKVRTWQVWNQSGADFRTEPPRPRDSEFKLARRAQVAA